MPVEAPCKATEMDWLFVKWLTFHLRNTILQRWVELESFEIVKTVKIESDKVQDKKLYR